METKTPGWADESPLRRLRQLLPPLARGADLCRGLVLRQPPLGRRNGYSLRRSSLLRQPPLGRRNGYSLKTRPRPSPAPSGTAERLFSKTQLPPSPAPSGTAERPSSKTQLPPSPASLAKGRGTAAGGGGILPPTPPKPRDESPGGVETPGRADESPLRRLRQLLPPLARGLA